MDEVPPLTSDSDLDIDLDVYHSDTDSDDSGLECASDNAETIRGQ